jgi:hypothetical protein
MVIPNPFNAADNLGNLSEIPALTSKRHEMTDCQ